MYDYREGDEDRMREGGREGGRGGGREGGRRGVSGWVSGHRAAKMGVDTRTSVGTAGSHSFNLLS